MKHGADDPIVLGLSRMPRVPREEHRYRPVGRGLGVLEPQDSRIFVRSTMRPGRYLERARSSTSAQRDPAWPGDSRPVTTRPQAEARLPIARAINISPSRSAQEPRPRPATTGAGRSCASCRAGCSTEPTPASRPLSRQLFRSAQAPITRVEASARNRSMYHAGQLRRDRTPLLPSREVLCLTQEPRARHSAKCPLTNKSLGAGDRAPSCPPRRHSIQSQVDRTATRAHAPATRPRRQASGPFLATPYTKTRDERLSDGPRLGGGPTARALVRLSRASSRTARIESVAATRRPAAQGRPEIRHHMSDERVWLV